MKCTYEDVLEYETNFPSNMSLIKSFIANNMIDTRQPLCDIDMTPNEENCILCLLEEFGLKDPLWRDTTLDILNKYQKKLYD